MSRLIGSGESILMGPDGVSNIPIIDVGLHHARQIGKLYYTSIQIIDDKIFLGVSQEKCSSPPPNNHSAYGSAISSRRDFHLIHIDGTFWVLNLTMSI